VKRTFIYWILMLAMIFPARGQFNEKRSLAETNHRIYRALYDPSGQYIVSTGSDNNIIIWNAGTGIIYRTLTGLKKRPNGVVFSGKKGILYSAGEDGLITTWNMDLVQVTATTPGHSDAINALAIHNERSLLATGGDDRVLRLWSLTGETPELVYELQGHRKPITCLDFSPDGSRIVSGSGDGTLALWDTQSGTKLAQVDAHDGWVFCVRFSPEGRQLCSGGDDRLLRIRDASTLEEIRVLEGHTGWVQSCSYTPSGKKIISGGHDDRVRIWDASTGKQEGVSDKLENIVLSVDASPVRNDFISTCMFSEHLRVWAYGTGGEMAAATAGRDNGEPVSPATVAEELPATEARTVPGKEGETGTDVPVISVFSPMAVNGKVTHDRSSLLVVGKAEAGGGIQTVLVNRKLANLNDAGVFQAEISLSAGENSLEVVAVSKKGKMASSIMTVLCTDESATLAREEDSSLRSGRYYALIIAINEYADDRITDLDYPIQDADTLYETLITHYSFRKEDVTYLKNPTRTEMIIQLDQLSQKITSEDNLLIFYAGHGFWDEKTGIGYWLPSDAARSNTANWFGNSTLRDFIGGIRSRHTLLIADACFSGSIFKTRSAFAAGEQGVRKLYDLPSRKAMTSGAMKEEVPDRSVFVKYLVQELRQNEASYLPSEELFGNFKTAVLNNSPNVPQYGTIQNVGDEGGDFIFIRK
jgi:WD40 repeat protein